MLDEDLAKGTIMKLSNIPLRDDDERGLIVDFALEDARKMHKRDLINQSKKEKQEQRKRDILLEKLEDKKHKQDNQQVLKLKEEANNKKKFNKNKPEKKENITPLTEINDDNHLIKMFYDCVSRGKRQRILKRLMVLKSTSREEVDKLVNSQRDKYKPAKPVKQDIENKVIKSNNKAKTEDEYEEKVIENDRTEINKKSNKIKRQEKKEIKLLSKKRKKEEIEKIREEEEMDGGMNQYFQMIEKKLKESS